MKKFRILSVMLAAAIATVACNKDNPTGGGNVTEDPNTCTVSFENIADLDITKTTWVITGEATLDSWLAMIRKMREVEAKGESAYGTISVIMPDVTVSPAMNHAFTTENGGSPGEPNNVLVSFSGPKMLRIPGYMFANCQKLETVDLPFAMFSWSQTTTGFNESDVMSNTFTDTPNLKEIDLPYATVLGNKFALNSGAEVIRLPRVIELQSRELFGGNDCLKEIYFTTTGYEFTVGHDDAFSKIGAPLTIYYANSNTRRKITNAIGDKANGHTVTYVDINAEQTE